MENYVADPIYHCILNNLIEDEIFSELEMYDTQIFLHKELIAKNAEKLAQQGKLLAQQKDMLRTSIRMLMQSGLSIEAISKALNISEEEVIQLS